VLGHSHLQDSQSCPSLEQVRWYQRSGLQVGIGQLLPVLSRKIQQLMPVAQQGMVLYPSGGLYTAVASTPTLADLIAAVLSVQNDSNFKTA